MFSQNFASVMFGQMVSPLTTSTGCLTKSSTIFLLLVNACGFGQYQFDPMTDTSNILSTPPRSSHLALL